MKDNHEKPSLLDDIDLSQYINLDPKEEVQYITEPPDQGPHPWRQPIVCIVGFLLLSFCALLFLPLPFGNLRVEQTTTLTEKEIMVTAGINEPVNILQINADKVEKRLAKDLRIEKATVTYEFPLTLHMQIAARPTVAIVMTQFGYASLDKNNQVIRLSEGVTEAKVPIISGIRLGNILLGDEIQNQGIKNAIIFLKSLSAKGLAELSELNVGDPNAMVAYTVEGMPLRIGDGTELPEKAKLAEDMIKDVKARNIDVLYLDVNVAAPFIKMR